ncbi:alpha/beta hydrolase [Pseudonocardia phyllosphaerae]|uniref:alpha/beta hydrolase n=1 Tax=Pseudonocardia phyllosphaerae TaxID=3390502 RepID=UPI0039797511
MPTVAELLAVDPSGWLHRAADWDALGRGLAAQVAELDRAASSLGRDRWVGADADAARGAHAVLRGRLAAAASSAAGTAAALEDWSGRVLAAQRTLLAAVAATDPLLTAFDTASGLPRLARTATLAALTGSLPRFAADAALLGSAVVAATTAAARADDDAVTVLRGLGPAAAPTPPVAPAQVRDWWHGLGPDGRAQLLHDDPALVGTLDGIPLADRDRANRLRLDGELTGLRSRLAAERRRGAMRAAGRTTAALAGLEAAAHALAAPSSYLLDVGPGAPGGGGRLVVALGNPERAAHVVTHVPGTASGWASAGEDLRRVTATRDAAALRGTGEVAAILWTGYDAPPGLGAATSALPARAAAEPLRRFQQGLRDGHDGPVHLTVVGHSYGSVVAGAAARGGPVADDVVLVGSPGAGASRAADLGGAGRVWATTAEHDPVRFGPGPEMFGTSRPFGPTGLSHGPDPAGPAFGARVFGSAPGHVLPTADDPATPTDESALAAAHSAYWDPGAPSLTTLGDIVAGTNE